jgi:ATP-binding cassette subfamily B protein/ATP-binding cassette subfamily C protein
MFNNFKKLKEILFLSGIKNFNFIFVFIFINSFFELFSIGILIPYLTLLLDPNVYYKIFNSVRGVNFFGIENLLLIEKKFFLLFFTILIFLLFTVKFIVNILFSYYLSYSKIKYEKKISLTILNNFMNTNNFSYLNFSVSKILYDITNRISTVSTCVINFGNLFAEIIVFTFIAGFIFFSLTNEKLYIFFFLLITFIIFFTFYKYKAVKWSKLRGIGGDLRNKNLIDILEGIREIIIYSSYKNLLLQFKRNNNIYLDPLQKMLFWGSVPKIFLELIVILFFLITLLYYIFFELNYSQLVLSSSILLVLLLRLLPSINRIIYNYAQIKYATDPILSVRNLFIFNNNSLINYSSIFKFEKKILLTDVSFGYSNSNKILESVNFEIRKNSKIGIYGETGSGKTTLIDIIVGIKKTSQGKIFIDDQELTNNNLKNWMKNVAYVPQRVYLFNSSLRNNITFANDDQEINNDKFTKILEFVELDNFIINNKDKEFLKIQEFGKNISGGQRQKIGIARALFSERPLIILDETTNSLDKKTERNILFKIEKLENKTILFITHNVDNLENFDNIYKIKDKTISQIK